MKTKNYRIGLSQMLLYLFLMKLEQQKNMTKLTRMHFVKFDQLVELHWTILSYTGPSYLHKFIIRWLSRPLSIYGFVPSSFHVLLLVVGSLPR